MNKPLLFPEAHDTEGKLEGRSSDRSSRPFTLTQPNMYKVKIDPRSGEFEVEGPEAKEVIALMKESRKIFDGVANKVKTILDEFTERVDDAFERLDRVAGDGIPIVISHPDALSDFISPTTPQTDEELEDAAIARSLIPNALPKEDPPSEEEAGDDGEKDNDNEDRTRRGR